MTASTIRSFSFGLLLATCIIGIVYYTSMEQTIAKPQERIPKLTEKSAKSFLEEKGYKIVSKQEWTQPQSEQKPDKPVLSQPTPPSNVTITVSAGTTSSDVANALQKQGVIKNTSDFIQYLTDHQLNQKIQIGTYKIKQGMSIVEISKIITQ
ncbi:endolytic transglycosylase MltG [Priestia koreensis]|uniref:endolytic transglycosylase MltG n=1 Tax=Priestia koreensis TaxID=284581 RepID=UPI0028F72ECB|nr:endolytic transglycosylase MltG [Priestia koreensis]